MYKLYTDKSEVLEAKIKIAGISSDKVKCRVMAESSDWTLSFAGSVSSDGDCKIKIPAIEGVLKNGDTGKLTLEVIAGDTLFSIWEDEFTIETSKSVTVESISINNETTSPQISIIHERQKPKVNITKMSKKLCKVLINNDIGIQDLKNRYSDTTFMMAEFFEDYNLSRNEQAKIISESISILSKLKK